MTNDNNKIYTLTKKPQVVGKYDDIDIRFITEEAENILDEMIENVREYIQNNNGFGTSEENKNELYSNAQKMVMLYSNTLGNTKFSLNIGLREFQFMCDYIQNHAEYNIENVFVGLEVKNFFEALQANFPKTGTGIVPLDPTSMTFAYHVVSKWTCIGWNEDTDTFIRLITAFGQISSLIKYYDAQVKILTDDVQDWVYLFEPQITKEDIEKTKRDAESKKEAE